MQIGPRLPSLGGSVGRAIGAVTEPLKKVATSPLGLGVLGTVAASPVLGGLLSNLSGGARLPGPLNLDENGHLLGGIASKVPGSPDFEAPSGGGGNLIGDLLGRLGLSPKDALGFAGGAIGGIMNQRNQDATRAQAADQFNRTVGLQERQYADQHARQAATSAGLSPVIQRLLGQWGGAGLGDLLGQHPAPPAPQVPRPAMMAPQAPQVQPQPVQPPAPDEEHPVMQRLGYGPRLAMRRAA